ncbi:MAG: hypothetical protein IPO27_06010 [Bacteroidetes bacterium]|nr:hypothetical protein [Bacteroidota bacterium]
MKNFGFNHVANVSVKHGKLLVNSNGNGNFAFVYQLTNGISYNAAVLNLFDLFLPMLFKP